MNDRLSTAFLAIASVSAAVMTALTIESRFGLAAPRSQQPRENRQLDEWTALISRGHVIGDSGASITILEFADFECPACRGFAETTLKQLRETYPGKVALVYRHWPLPYHRFARPAALASECAAEQGRFEAFHDLLFAKQDSLGLKAMVEFAAEAGVGDTATFQDCLRSQKFAAVVDEDAAIPLSLKAVGTPTIAINGVLYGRVPGLQEITDIIESAGTR